MNLRADHAHEDATQKEGAESHDHEKSGRGHHGHHQEAVVAAEVEHHGFHRGHKEPVKMEHQRGPHHKMYASHGSLVEDMVDADDEHFTTTAQLESCVQDNCGPALEKCSADGHCMEIVQCATYHGKHDVGYNKLSASVEKQKIEAVLQKCQEKYDKRD